MADGWLLGSLSIVETGRDRGGVLQFVYGSFHMKSTKDKM